MVKALESVKFLEINNLILLIDSNIKKMSEQMNVGYGSNETIRKSRINSLKPLIKKLEKNLSELNKSVNEYQANNFKI